MVVWTSILLATRPVGAIMDGLAAEWTDWRAGGQTGGRVDRQSDCGLMGETDGGRTDRPLEGRMDGRTDGRKEGETSAEKGGVT